VAMKAKTPPVSDRACQLLTFPDCPTQRREIMARIECTICDAGMVAIVLDVTDVVEMLLCPRCGRREWRQRDTVIDLRQALETLHDRATSRPSRSVAAGRSP
jgi:hypothetical protein